MFILRRLFAAAGFALLGGILGIIAGVLMAPAKGEDTQRRLSSLVQQHGPAVVDGIRKGQQKVEGAIDYVRAKIDSAANGN